MFRLLTSPGAIPSGAALREHRVTTGLSLAAAAAQVGTSQARLSRLERGTLHNADLAASYQELLTSIISPAA